jgi:hypothetical protein
MKVVTEFGKLSNEMYCKNNKRFYANSREVGCNLEKQVCNV